MQGYFGFFFYFIPIWNNALLYTYLLDISVYLYSISVSMYICIYILYDNIAYNLSDIYAFALPFVTNSINIIQTAFMIVLRFVTKLIRSLKTEHGLELGRGLGYRLHRQPPHCVDTSSRVCMCVCVYSNFRCI